MRSTVCRCARWLMGHIHTLSKLAALIAPIANPATTTPLGRPGMAVLGVHRNRKMAPFVNRTFVHRFRAHRKQHPVAPTTRGKARRLHFHDTFATYNYPNIGLAAALPMKRLI